MEKLLHTRLCMLVVFTTNLRVIQWTNQIRFSKEMELNFSNYPKMEMSMKQHQNRHINMLFVWMKQEHIDKRTVYRDIDICVSDLTALLFGVGGIENL